MESPAYILGALDVLVKAGEVSPAYADGVRSVMEKDAGGWPWMWFDDDPGENYRQELRQWIKDNPGRYRKDENGNSFLDISGREAEGLMYRSRHWHDDFWKRLGSAWRNKAGQAKAWVEQKINGQNYGPTTHMIERNRNVERNRDYIDYMHRISDADPTLEIHPSIWGAIQDTSVSDAGFRLEDAKRTMSETKRKSLGLTDNYPETFRTPEGNAAILGGRYKPKFDTKEVPARKKPVYEGALSSEDYWQNKRHLNREPVR